MLLVPIVAITCGVIIFGATVVLAWRCQTWGAKPKPTDGDGMTTNIGIDISAMTKNASSNIGITPVTSGNFTFGPGTITTQIPHFIGPTTISGTFIRKGGVVSYTEEYTEMDLPERDDDEPIGAFKLANLCWRPGGLRLESLNYGIVHERLAEAVCHYRHCTMIPDLDCSCGFYALKDRESARDYGPSYYTALLEVELSGRVLVCSDGYRAQWQRILRVEVAGGCYYCGGPVDRVAIMPHVGDAVTMRCAEHVLPTDIVLPTVVAGMPLSFVGDAEGPFGVPPAHLSGS
jgi:hypothetical protein